MNPHGLSVLALIWRDLRRTWATLTLTSVLYRILAAAILTPLVAFVLWAFLATSGREVVADEDLLLVLLDPIGWAGLIVIGGLTLTIIAMEQACLMTIAFGSVRDLAVSMREALHYAFARGGRVLALATRIVVRVILIAVPFLAASGAVYAALLTEFDINFYLSQRPPVFWTAVVLLGLVLAGLSATLIVVLVRWAFALPLVLFENVEPARAFRASAERTHGGRWTIALSLIGWGVTCLVLSALATELVSLLGQLLVPLATGSLPWLLFVLGTVLLLFVLFHLTVSLIQAIAFSLIVVHLYERYSTTQDTRRPWATTFARLGDHIPARISARVFRWGAFAALAIATGVAGALLHEAELEDRTEITAHRGASRAAPENTLAAVKQAIEDGAHWVEIDVQRTADNEVVVIHDRDLRRIGGVNLRVADAMYAELSAIDVGAWFGPEFRGERVPKLDQVLALCKGRIKVNIELKYYGSDERLAERVVEIVETQGMVDQIITMSLRHDAVRQMKALRPDWTTGLLTAVAVGDLTRINVDFYAVKANVATRRFVRRAHRRSRQVYAWTVNDVVGMTTLISRGVDNLITDEPALAMAVLRDRAQLSPAERLLVKVGLMVGVRPAPPSDL
ncbi:MAG: glycerophosphodiester phosphodiesterase family protein [Acidiferrobacterales bacterium]